MQTIDERTRGDIHFEWMSNYLAQRVYTNANSTSTGISDGIREDGRTNGYLILLPNKLATIKPYQVSDSSLDACLPEMDSFIGHLKLHRPKDGAYAQIGNDFHWIGILHNVINGDAAPDNQLANYLPENFAKQQTRLNHFIGSKTRTAILYAKHLGIECVVSKKTGFGEAGFGTINHFSTGGKLKQRSWIDRSEKDFHLVHEIYSPNLELETFRSYKIQGNDITL